MSDQSSRCRASWVGKSHPALWSLLAAVYRSRRSVVYRRTINSMTTENVSKDDYNKPHEITLCHVMIHCKITVATR